METPSVNGIDKRQLQFARRPKHVRGSTAAVSMHNLYLLTTEKVNNLLLYMPVEGFLCRNDMTLDSHALQAVNHFTRGKRQPNGFELVLIQEIGQVKQMRLSTSYLPLTDYLQNLYPAHLFFTKLSSESL